MSDHFQGIRHIELQPGDLNFPVAFRFSAASATTKNDGSMPYGSSVQSVVSSIKDDRGVDASSSLISSSKLDGNTVTVYLSHSSDVEDGRYTLTTKVSFTLSGSTRFLTREYDFRRVYLRNE